MNTCKYTSDQALRDRGGHFLPGMSGNPAGRPRGATCSALRLARDAAETVALPTLIQAARDGDLDACKVLVAYGLPRQKPVDMPVAVPLPDTDDLSALARAVLDLLRRGDISLSAAGDLMHVLGTAARVEEIADLKDQVENLKLILKQRG